MNDDARKVIASLGLEPLPREGGFFRQTWRSKAGSAIYFLLTPENFSALHRLRRTDELWHYYAGDAVEHVMLPPPDGGMRVTTLGREVMAGEVPQLIVPAGVWQGARLKAEETDAASAGARAGWALLGCTLVPAWDEGDFELALPADLLRAFPAAAKHIRGLNR